ncbi:MAG TPA: hypothetical protein DCS87_03925 [Rheinheimera sp.]|nr:hypothetical protein [Rheinheimera sp.]
MVRALVTLGMLSTIWACSCSAATKAPALPALKAGVWQSQHQLWIDNVDVIADLKQQQQGLIGFLPKAQQAKVQQMVQQKDPSKTKQCLPSAQAKTLKTPQDYQKWLKQKLPKCQLSFQGQQGNLLRFGGHCNAQQGYTGTVSAQLQVHNSTRLTLQVQGQGKALVPGYSDGRSQSQFRVHSDASWTGASCG